MRYIFNADRMKKRKDQQLVDAAGIAPMQKSAPEQILLLRKVQRPDALHAVLCACA